MTREKKDKAKLEKSTCPRISIFKRLKGKIFTMDHDKALKISHATRMMTGGNNGVHKQRKGSSKIRHHPSTLEIFKQVLTQGKGSYGEKM